MSSSSTINKCYIIQQQHFTNLGNFFHRYEIFSYTSGSYNFFLWIIGIGAVYGFCLYRWDLTNYQEFSYSFRFRLHASIWDMIKKILDFCYNLGPIYLSELIDISLDSYNLPLQNETKMGGESSRTSELSALNEHLSVAVCEFLVWQDVDVRAACDFEV